MIKLSNKWAEELSWKPEWKMDSHYVRIVLKDGTIYDDVIVAGGWIVKAGIHNEIPFKETDIGEIVVTKGPRM